MVMPISRRRVAKNRVLRSLTDISSPLSVGYVKRAIGHTTAAQWPTTGHRHFLGRNRRHLTTAEVPLDPEHLAEPSGVASSRPGWGPLRTSSCRSAAMLRARGGIWSAVG